MAFCRDLCEGLVGSCRHCMTTPITRTKIYWFSGVTLFLIVFIIILSVSIPSGGDSDSGKGSDALKTAPLSVGVNYDIAKFHENTTVETFDKTKLNYLHESAIKVQIFGVQAPCGSQFKDSATLTLDEVDFLGRLLPGQGLKVATSESELRAASSNGGIAAVLAVNGGQSIDLRLSMIRILYNMGVRILSVNTFECSTPWAKSAGSTGKETYTLTDFGKAAVEEMNRVGMMIDIAGADIATQEAILDASKAPVAAISVGLMAVKDHPLNLDSNKIIPKLKTNGGLVMLTTDCDLIFKPGNGTCDKSAFTGLLKEAKSLGLKVGLGGSIIAGSAQALAYKDVPVYWDWLLDNEYSMDFLKGLSGDNFIQTLAAVQKYADSNKNITPKEDTFDKSKLDNKSCYSDVSSDPAPQPTSKPDPAPQPTEKPTEKPTQKTEPSTAPKAETKSLPDPSPQPEPTPAPQPEPTPAPQPEPTPAPQPEPTPAPQPEPTPAPQPEPTPAPQPEPTPAPQPEPNPAPQPAP